jgi:hypothetical protein
MIYSTNKRIDKVAHNLIKMGWLLKRAKRHPRISSPDGKITVTVPSSPSCSRAELNWISQLKHAGVDPALLC